VAMHLHRKRGTCAPFRIGPSSGISPLCLIVARVFRTSVSVTLWLMQVGQSQMVSLGNVRRRSGVRRVRMWQAQTTVCPVQDDNVKYEHRRMVTVCIEPRAQDAANACHGARTFDSAASESCVYTDESIWSSTTYAYGAREVHACEEVGAAKRPGLQGPSRHNSMRECVCVCVTPLHESQGPQSRAAQCSPLKLWLPARGLVPHPTPHLQLVAERAAVLCCQLDLELRARLHWRRW